MANKLYLGDKVFPKKIGLPIYGTVSILYLSGEFYNSYYKLTPNCPLWDHYYPNWLKNQIAYIKFDTPSKVFNMDEIRLMLYDKKKDLSDTDVKRIIDHMSLEVGMYYPIEDLELVEIV